MTDLDYSAGCTRSFANRRDERRYWVLLVVFLALGVLATIGLIFYKNPIPPSSSSFIPVVKRRINSAIAMIFASACHSLSTIAFQTITNNRVITPSLLGFEAVYETIQTSVMYFFGAKALMDFSDTRAFLIQIGLMVLVCVVLYSNLLSDQKNDMSRMLLIGIILGSGLRSLSSFMRRLLSPSEFDLLQAKMFGSVNNANPDYFLLAFLIIVIAGGVLLANSKKLNIMSLGRDVAINLGINYRNNLIITLILISILMAVSTALVGPINFFGFLVATLTYQLAQTYDHKYLFSMGLSLGFVILTGAYFIMYHIADAQGVVSIVIEFVGGLVFLIKLLRSGNL